MAKNSIRDYSATNSSNTDIQSIDISEGCSPAGINNAIREVMADLKDVSTGAVALESPAFDSASLTGDLTFGDNDKAIFGAGSDLQIYHDGSNSLIEDVGTGPLRIRSSSVSIENAAGTETLSNLSQNGAVTIYYDGSPKLATTATGVDVTGTMTADDVYVATSLRHEGDTDTYLYFPSAGNTIGLVTGGSEAMRINSGGSVLVNKTSSSLPTVGHEFFSNGAAYHTRDNGAVLYVNRLNGDGTLVGFYQDTVLEGRINVSGTTVSLIGGHLARWSQLNDGAKDEAIVKGTVLTNLDQMAVWHHEAVAATYYAEGDELPEITPATYYTEDDTLPEGVSVGDEKIAAVYAQISDEKTPAADAYTEDNEQLNCMAVSSVEGDPNVAGVFVSWDNDDDEFNDMNVAMTGDMVIRIASGTTVARGDLLMSAGDGTAKPQGDDIVRSKTIAKVTSTHVSHTYDDGSYLVPCVLMAC